MYFYILFASSENVVSLFSFFLMDGPRYWCGKWRCVTDRVPWYVCVYVRTSRRFQICNFISRERCILVDDGKCRPSVSSFRYMSRVDVVPAYLHELPTNRMNQFWSPSYHIICVLCGALAYYCRHTHSQTNQFRRANTKYKFCGVVFPAQWKNKKIRRRFRCSIFSAFLW